MKFIYKISSVGLVLRLSGTYCLRQYARRCSHNALCII